MNPITLQLPAAFDDYMRRTPGVRGEVLTAELRRAYVVGMILAQLSAAGEVLLARELAEGNLGPRP